MPDVAGLASRSIAADILDGVLRKRRQLDELLDGAHAHPGLAGLEGRDRALTRTLVATALRRLGTLRHLLGLYLDRGLPADAPKVEMALLVGAVQILWLDVPDHAAVDLSVRLVHGDRRAGRYAGLINAVLRRMTESGKRRLADLDTPVLDTPPWLMARWTANYGEATARAIAAAHATEPALDLSVKDDPAGWAGKLGGTVLPGGTVRAIAHGPIAQLSGYDEGAWWVQDAAAALPARLLGDVAGRRVADLCAAPGGKTAQLAAAGAQVAAVDQSHNRLARVGQNLERLKLTAELVEADATKWTAEPFDAVLLDAPCSSTGTIRRNPDVPWLKTEADIVKLRALQQRLIAHAVDLLRPGGTLVYCVCSLEPEEGVAVVDALLAADPRVARQPILPAEVDDRGELIIPAGDLRTLPFHQPDPNPRLSGMDGFFAARLVRR